MIGGFSGKILRINLTAGEITTLDSQKYLDQGFLGGNGLGTAVVWDLLKDFSIDGLDVKNIITIMPGGLAGTLVPGAGRTEVTNFSTAGFPTMDAKTMYCNPWYSRSNVGGKVATMIKLAGWDGIVIEGRASNPCWINIVNDKVTLEDAGPKGHNLWGLDTWATQEAVWQIVAANQKYGGWLKLASGDDYTTQRPAVLCIGPAGETLSRFAALVHEGGGGAGDGGAGSVFGSKRLKAISVLGSGSVTVADPKALMETRKWHWANYSYDVDNPGLPSDASVAGKGRQTTAQAPGIRPGYNSGSFLGQPLRYSSCSMCFAPCKNRYQDGVYNDMFCSDSWGTAETPRVAQQIASDMHKFGFNTRIIKRTSTFVRALQSMGLMGVGKKIDSGKLQLENFGSFGWAHSLFQTISDRKEQIGNDLAEGPIRFAAKIGRLAEELATGDSLAFPQQGNLNSEAHQTFCGGEWAYGSLIQAKDINEHDFFWNYKAAAAYSTYGFGGLKGPITAEQFANHVSDCMAPYQGDPFMLDYGEGETGIYSVHKAKQIAWHRHWSRFFKQTLGLCDWQYPYWFNSNASDLKGNSPEVEVRYLNAVTGLNMNIEQGMEIGRKIFNMDRAILTLQGRHRDVEKFSAFMYTAKAPRTVPDLFTVYKDKQWQWWGTKEFSTPGNWGPTGKSNMDPAGVEEWKTHFYKVEGWDTKTGWPTRATLDGLKLGYVADKLYSAGKLGTA
jgi:aldehyde:ferredoxin oxidoreductase